MVVITHKYLKSISTSDYKKIMETIKNNMSLENTDITKSLDLFDVIYIAGQAESHCVANSLKQIMELAPNIAKKFVVLEDTMSPVPGFEDLANPIYEKAREMGVKFETTLVNQ